MTTKLTTWIVKVGKLTNPKLVAQLQSEADYLRSQLDKQTSLLAVATQQNASLTKQLERLRTTPAVIAWVKTVASKTRHTVNRSQVIR